MSITDAASAAEAMVRRGMGRSEPTANRGQVALVPIGPISSELLTWLANRLEEILDMRALAGDSIALPEAAYNSKRDQYAGRAFLNALRAHPSPGAERILGLTDVDCFAPGLNFIFGQADLRGGPAFVALPRLRSSFYGLPEDADLFRERVLKEAIHELGHTWGLRHCDDPRCVMHFSNRLQDTDVKAARFCPRCARALG